MDSTQESPTVLSLCSGYGGIERGLARVFGGVSVLAHVEIEAFAIANLVNEMETGQMDPAPIWTDVKTFRPEIFRGCVDILTGGYPCQPFSAAGKRRGEDDPRHLWPYIRSIIDRCRPEWVFLENVEGHLTKGIVQVLADLEGLAYRPECGVFSAAEVGAPHQRKRVFILAHSLQPGLERHSGDGAGRLRQEREIPKSDRPTGSECVSLWPARPGEAQFDWEAPRVVADNKRRVIERRTRSRTNRRQRKPEQTEAPCTGGPRYDGPEETQPRLGRTTYGSAHRTDRLRLLGNGVVPQTAEKAFITLYNTLIGENN